MPIDRAFVLKGVGAVVTGTLVRGALREGGFASISSPRTAYRIRTLHNHSTLVSNIAAGRRVGVHLHGLKAEDVQRGDVLVSPDYPFRSRRINARIELLKRVPFAWKPGLRAHFLAASFEMECRLWGLVASSDGGAWIQIELPREACFYAGQRFILRSTNPLTTVGGGTILDIAPDRPRRVTEAELNRARYFEISRPAVFDLAALSKKWMCPAKEILTKDVRASDGLVWHVKLDEAAAAMLREWIAQAKDQTAEWPFEGVAAALKINPDYAGRYLEALVDAKFHGVLTLTASTLRYDPRRGDLSESEQRIGEEIVSKLRAAGLQPLRLAEYSPKTPAERKMFDKVAGRLVKDGRVVRVDNEFVLERSVWDDLKKKVQQASVVGFTASEFGKHFGLSRKYSVPYLECLNRMNILRRQGDRHVIVRK